MIASAEVWLWGTRIGIVALVDESGVASFEYDDDFAQSGIEPAPLTMPLSHRVYSFPQLSYDTFRGLPGLLADSLPDKFGNALIDAWLAGQGRMRGSMNPIERLCYTGTRGMGALEFKPSIELGDGTEEGLNAFELSRLASRVLSMREAAVIQKQDATAAQILRVGTSAGGARAKALVAWNEDTGEIRSGQVKAQAGFSYWLMKLDGVDANSDKEDSDPQGYTNIEFAYYLMACAAGIAMNECRLFPDGDLRHFMARRFDRTPEGEKIHMQTLGALAHFDFNVARAHSYEQAAMIMRQTNLGADEVEELFRRMVFNVFACNHDDHVKNISFLMNRRGEWRLAPAYDVTYAYNPQGAWTNGHQMTINGKSREIGRADLMESARAMMIKSARARAIIDDVREAVGLWKGFAQDAGVSEENTEAIALAHVRFSVC